MNAPRLALADRLRHHIRAALDAADLDRVIATTDALDIASGERHGIVVISAPRLTFDGTFRDVQTEYQLHVIAGPADNYLAAWAVIDEIIQALVDGDINLKEGEPGAYQPRAGVALPSYTLTLNDLDDDE